jgi:hypothetical protein
VKRQDPSNPRPGERTIQLKVVFWTNDLGDKKGRIRPRHAWTSGVVRLDKNTAHGVGGGRPVPFTLTARAARRDAEHAPSNALQRTRSAPLRSLLSFET